MKAVVSAILHATAFTCPGGTASRPNIHHNPEMVETGQHRCMKGYVTDIIVDRAEAGI